jgi:hypothetical protein
VRRARHGKEFRKPLDNRQYQKLPKTHTTILQ